MWLSRVGIKSHNNPFGFALAVHGELFTALPRMGVDWRVVRGRTGQRRGRGTLDLSERYNLRGRGKR